MCQHLGQVPNTNNLLDACNYYGRVCVRRHHFFLNWILFGIFISSLSAPATRKPVYYEQMNMKPGSLGVFFGCCCFHGCVCVRAGLSVYCSCVFVCV